MPSENLLVPFLTGFSLLLLANTIFCGWLTKADNHNCSLSHSLSVGRGHDPADQLPLIEMWVQRERVSITMSLRGAKRRGNLLVQSTIVHSKNRCYTGRLPRQSVDWLAMTVVVGSWVHRSSCSIITPGRRGHDRALQWCVAN